MSATLTTPKTTSGGEIITHLINSTDGTGLHFDGAAGKVAFTAPDLGEKYSLEFIVSGDARTGVLSLLDIYDSGDSKRIQFAWSGNTDGQLQLAINSTWATAFGATPANGDPVHLVVAVDGTSATCYQNGNALSTQTVIANAVTSATGAAVGSNFNASSEFFNGTIYRCRFWNKTLSQAEVTASYENATVPFADQYGSQTIVIPGDFTGNLDGWDASNTWNSQTNPSNNMVLAASGTAQRCRTSTQLTLGKSYRCTYTATSTAGAPAFAYHDSGTEYAFTATVGSSTITNGTASYFEFVMPSTISTKYFYILATTASDGVTLDDVSVREIGCVSDYDLAFANPTQSLMVQDRAGAADGTSSATGVKQVTPIEQLNSKSARIGTSAATPADGDLLVSGNVGVGGSPTSLLTVRDDNAFGGADNQIVAQFSPSVTLNEHAGIAFGTYGGSDDYLKTGIFWKRTGSYGVGDLIFANNGTADTSTVSSTNARLTINSAGTVTATGAIVAQNVAQSTSPTTGGITAAGGIGVVKDVVVGGTLKIGTDGATNGIIQVTGAAQDMHLRTNGTTRLTIATNGAKTFNTDAGHGYVAFQDLTTLSGYVGSGNSLAPVDFGNTDLVFRANNDVVFVASNGTGLADGYQASISGTTGVMTVKQPGWPLKNELTNSGFDVWSNSTLVSATTGATPALEDAGDLVNAAVAGSGTAWTGATGATPPNGWAAGQAADYNIDSSSGSGAEPGLLIVHDGANNNPWMWRNFTTVVGKLYKLQFRAVKTTADIQVGIGTSAGGLQIDRIDSSNTSWADYSSVFEATTTSTFIYVQSVTSTSGHYARFDSFMLHEVTPGCVAADALAMDGWGKTSTIDLLRVSNNTTNIKGMYGCLMTTGSAAYEEIQQPESASRGLQHHYDKYRGRTVTFGCWVYPNSVTGEGLRLYMRDQDGYSYSTEATADSLQWLEVTRTISSTAWTSTSQYFQLGVLYDSSAGAGKTCYVSEPMLVFGSAIGEGNYSRPSGEIVWFEARAFSNKYSNVSGLSTQAIAVLNLEADSNGKIPKGAQAVSATTLVRDSDSAASSTAFVAGRDTAFGYAQFQNYVSGKANDKYSASGGEIVCDSNGDIYTYILASGSGTFDIDTFYYYGVQLR